MTVTERKLLSQRKDLERILRECRSPRAFRLRKKLTSLEGQSTLDVVLKLCLSLDDACLISQLLKGLKASDLIEYAGESRSHDASDGFKRLFEELISEIPPGFVEEIELGQEIYVATRLKAEEVQALKRCLRNDGFLQLIKGRNPKKPAQRVEKVLYELLLVLDETFNLYDDPYQHFDRRR